jgi:hypothetical protein
MLLEREVEQEYRPQMLARLQQKVDAVAEQAQALGAGLCAMRTKNELSR